MSGDIPLHATGWCKLGVLSEGFSPPKVSKGAHDHIISLGLTYTYKMY